MSTTVFITGCSSGFGEAAAMLFSSRGWNVVATVRKPDDGSGLTDLKNMPSFASMYRTAIVSTKQLKTRSVIFGQIDLIVNNAGYGLFSLFEPASREAIQKQFDVNVFGTMDVIRAVLPHFRANRAGTIINISSGAGVFGAAMASIYCASKFALEGFSKSLSYELADLGIKVKIVEPGAAPGTGFVARSQREKDALPIAEDYDAFIARPCQSLWSYGYQLKF